MNIKKTDKGYEVESSSKKGSFYKVDCEKPWCDCPAFKFREMKKGGVCKHITAVRTYREKNEAPILAAQEKIDKAVLEFVRDKQEVESIDLIDEFGEAAVERLISTGELIEKKGIITLLE